MDSRTALGLPSSAGADEIKAAYRKLAMQHHPDRGGQVADFQRIQSAYMELEKSGFAPARPQPQYRTPPNPSPGWSKPESPGGTWRDVRNTENIFDDFKKTSRGRTSQTRDYSKAQPDGEIIANVSLRQAFSGFNMEISQHTSAFLAGSVINNTYVNIPPGMPDGYRGNYTASDGSSRTITLRIDTDPFSLRGFTNSDNLFSAGLEVGDIEIQIQVDVIDLITGTWLTVKDFLGEEMKVRVPAGFNPLQRLKVANKGYASWDALSQKPMPHRRDMYIKITPHFHTPEEVDRQKIVNLYNAIGGESASQPA